MSHLYYGDFSFAQLHSWLVPLASRVRRVSYSYSYSIGISHTSSSTASKGRGAGAARDMSDRYTRSEPIKLIRSIGHDP